MYEHLSLYIAGEFIHEDRPLQDVLNPADGQVIGHLPHALTADLDRALQWPPSAPSMVGGAARRSSARTPVPRRCPGPNGRADRPQHHT